MNPKHGACEHLRDERLRVACGDLPRPARALHAHLADCPACRAELAETSALADALRGALAPAPLRTALRDELMKRLIAPRLRPALGPRLGHAGLAAAAALLLALGLQLVRHDRVPGAAATEPAALTAADADAIVAAYALLRWDGPLETSVAYLAQQVNQVSRCVEQDVGPGDLPWTEQDDWDLPAEEHKTSIVPATLRLAAAPRVGGYGPAL